MNDTRKWKEPNPSLDKDKDIVKHKDKVVPNETTQVDAKVVITPKNAQSIFLQAVATDKPLFTNPTHPPLVVPPGHIFYWASATSSLWTDNKDTSSNRPLYGWDFEPNEQVVTWLRRAQLMGVCSLGNGEYSAVGYEEKFDQSKGGTWYYINDSGKTRNYYWYMNDNFNYYSDNAGVANMTFIVMPYQ